MRVRPSVLFFCHTRKTLCSCKNCPSAVCRGEEWGWQVQVQDGKCQQIWFLPQINMLPHTQSLLMHCIHICDVTFALFANIPCRRMTIQNLRNKRLANILNYITQSHNIGRAPSAKQEQRNGNIRIL